MSYVGNTYSPTTKIDVFVTASSIKRPYTIIGKVYLANPHFPSIVGNMGAVQKKAKIRARAVGADAVLFYDYFITQNGSVLEPTGQIANDTMRRAIYNNYYSPAVNTVVQKQEILFLKYEN